MSERWRRIPAFPLYEVSSSGRVRRWVTGRQLTTYPTNFGHLKVHCGRSGRDKLVHRLVLEAFVGPCPDGMECRHLNGDPSDNRLDNLAWGSHEENMQDSVRHGTRARGRDNGNSKLTAEQVADIRRQYATGLVSQRSLAERFSVSQRTIWNIVNREQWCHV